MTEQVWRELRYLFAHALFLSLGVQATSRVRAMVDGAGAWRKAAIVQGARNVRSDCS